MATVTGQQRDEKDSPDEKWTRVSAPWEPSKPVDVCMYETAKGEMGLLPAKSGAATSQVRMEHVPEIVGNNRQDGQENPQASL